MTDTESAAPDTNPAKPSRLRKWGKRLLKTLAVLAVLLALLHAVEYWRGNRAYARAQADWKAAGLPVYAELFKDSAPVAPEKDLLAAPFFSEWKAQKSTTESFRNPLSPRLEKWGDHSVMRIIQGTGDWTQVDWRPLIGTPASTPETGASKPLEIKTDAKGNIVPQFKLNPAKPAAPRTGLVIAPVEGKSDAQTLIDALEADFPEFKDLAQTERSRPEISLGITYPTPERLFADLPTPSFKVVRAAAYPLMLHALAKLDAGDGAPALAATRACLRYEAAWSEQPTLLSAMINVVHAKLLPVRVTHAALARRAWSEADLAQAEQAFAAYSPLLGIHRALQGEACGGAALMTGIYKQSWEWFPLWLRVTTSIAPHGWLKLNAANHLDFMRELTSHDGIGQGRIDLKAIGEISQRQEESMTTLTNWATKLATPAFKKVMVNSADAQAKLNLARVGIALERHRLKTGAFPASLDALTPALLEKLPVSPMTGVTPAYSVNADGGYTLSYKDEYRDNADLLSFVPSGKDLLWTMPAPRPAN